MNRASTYPPVYGQAFDLYFQVTKNDGTIISSPAGLACRIVRDGVAFDGPTPELVDATSGTCVARLPAADMRGHSFVFTATATDSGALAYQERFHTAAQTLNQMARRERRRKIGGWA